MIEELLVATTVRAWSEEMLPADRGAADCGVALALRSFAAGASLSEACTEGRRFLNSWARHPSHRRQESVERVGAMPRASVRA